MSTEYTTNVGNSIVKTGCFEVRKDPRPFFRDVLKRPSHFNDDKDVNYVTSEILYSGLEGNTLHLTYREFTDQGFARSPFYQQLYYDLSKSQKVVFQEWLIDIIEANNGFLKYKVVNEPVRPATPNPSN
jgi:hypothetical protein